jgi:hypothetical protein
VFTFKAPAGTFKASEAVQLSPVHQFIIVVTDFPRT